MVCGGGAPGRGYGSPGIVGAYGWEENSSTILDYPRNCEDYQIVPIEEVPGGGCGLAPSEAKGWFAIKYEIVGGARYAIMSPAEASHEYILNFIRKHR